MSRNRLYIIINLIALLAFLVSFGSGLVLWLGPSVGSGRTGADFWTLARHDWFTIHLYASLILGLIVVVHILIHFSWIRNIGRLWKMKI